MPLEAKNHPEPQTPACKATSHHACPNLALTGEKKRAGKAENQTAGDKDMKDSRGSYVQAVGGEHREDRWGVEQQIVEGSVCGVAWRRPTER